VALDDDDDDVVAGRGSNAGCGVVVVEVRENDGG
jgi:hypothetical protein